MRKRRILLFLYTAISFIQRSSDLIHQENFSKGTTQDKISVKHPTQGLSGDWPSPLTVFLYPNINKSPQGICPAKKCQYKLTGFWEFPRISSILSCISATVCLRARAHSCAWQSNSSVPRPGVHGWPPYTEAYFQNSFLLRSDSFHHHTSHRYNQDSHPFGFLPT